MGILFWRKNKIIDVHARSLADEFYSQVQPAAALQFLEGSEASSKKELKKQKKELGKVDQIVANTASQILQFKYTEKLGVYGKARYHLKFMERLNDLGYPEETTKKLNEQILIKSS